MNKKKEINAIISEELKTKLLEEKNNYTAARTSKLQQGTIDNILTSTKKNINLTPPMKLSLHWTSYFNKVAQREAVMEI